MVLSKMQYVREGSMVPWYMGVAYWEPHRAVARVYPLPFHLVIRWARNLYFWVKATQRPDWFAAQLEQARSEGYTAGFQAGDAATLSRIERIEARLQHVRSREP